MIAFIKAILFQEDGFFIPALCFWLVFLIGVFNVVVLIIKHIG